MKELKLSSDEIIRYGEDGYLEIEQEWGIVILSPSDLIKLRHFLYELDLPTSAGQPPRG